MYCTRKDIERIYGKLNVSQWADLDGTADSDVIADRIQYNITQAGSRVDGDLGSSPYGTPFEEPYPDVIVYLTALQTGVLLYMGRRIVTDESENQVSAQQGLYQQLVDKINADTFKLLNVSRKSTKPIKVVESVEDLEYENEDPFFDIPCGTSF